MMRCTAGAVGAETRAWWGARPDYQCRKEGVRSVTAWGVTGWLCQAHALEVERMLRIEAEPGRAYQCRNCEHNRINHAADEPGCAVAACPCPAFESEAQQLKAPGLAGSGAMAPGGEE